MRKSFYLPESYPHYPPAKDFDTQHVVIELRVDFDKKEISGSCALTIRPFREDLTRIILDACEMEISGVAVDGASRDFEFDNRRLQVRTPPLGTGSHNVRVTYSAKPRDGVYFIGPDDSHPEKPFQAWTHGEAEFSRFWFPCHDHPHDKFTSETVITVPEGFTVVSNGVLVSRTKAPGTETFHWKEDRPHSSYLTSFVAGRFLEVREESEGVPLHYFIPESKKDSVASYFGETPRMVKVFNEITGVPYPFAKYAQTTVEDFIFGGMENVDATTLTTNRFHDMEVEDFQVTYSVQNRNAVSLVAHELAHQWFGDLVTCADWSHAWLNEGFADYMQLLYSERTRGEDEFRWDMWVNAQDVFSEDESDYRRPIVERNYAFADDVFDDTTYKKGAWMIHELRHLLGERAFFSGLRSYLTKFSERNADTHDFRKAMEETSGVPLEQFFEQSVFQSGFPEFNVAYAWDEGTKTATVTVRQTQEVDLSTPLFVLPCDLVFYTQRGRQPKRIQLRGPQQSFSFELDSEPSIVEFDPEQWLLKKVAFAKGLRLLLKQLERSEDSSSRAEAARDLGALKATQAIGALEAAAARDKFWFVSACALRALGEIGTGDALEAVLRVGKPSNSRVRRAAAEALGNFRDERALRTVEELLSTDPSPYVRCEAALSIAKQRGKEALPYLLEAMKTRSPNETLAEACLEAIGKSNNEEGWRVLDEYLAYGKPTRARIGAMKGIKARGRLLDSEVPVLKDILLSDPEYSVRDYLVSKLAPAVNDQRLLETLKRSSESDRDNRVRRGALEAYHDISNQAEAAGTISALKEEIEKLKKAVKGTQSAS